MMITFHLGEPFWRVVGARQVVLKLTAPLSVAEALQALMVLHPTLAKDLSGQEAPPLIFLNDAEVETTTLLTSDSTLHLVWPVSGG
jgi:hypothetical protein